ncbi:hypothetical protein GCM10010233_57950 [Streptomyces pseudogriseolus]|uniref:Uncharacterized protein n=1 Tax=Streptomyces pseudogriseolus TaxID=36817 RepID=A0ABQ2T9J7_STREZ|nr:hypothetical protein GCM10010233_57950 [Streptomyces gancidicus]GGS55618.1 hypothetical protein GCM10010285_38820 [Streptomyces rubiginosus]
MTQSDCATVGPEREVPLRAHSAAMGFDPVTGPLRGRGPGLRYRKMRRDEIWFLAGPRSLLAERGATSTLVPEQFAP